MLRYRVEISAQGITVLVPYYSGEFVLYEEFVKTAITFGFESALVKGNFKFGNVRRVSVIQNWGSLEVVETNVGNLARFSEVKNFFKEQFALNA